jgi:predicted Zn-dependent protease
VNPWHTRYFSLLALLLVLGACGGNPVDKKASADAPSSSKALRVGQEAHDKLVEEGAIYEDAALKAYVDKIGQRLVANSDKPDDKFEFHVIDSPDINAFALPGGYIYIHRGLLAYLNSEAELAAVLGHEIGHVTGRHHSRRNSRAVTSKVLSGIIYVLTGSGDLADASNIYGAELISGYGRELELEADELGSEYMHASGYDPEAMLNVLGILKSHEQYQRLQALSAGQKVATYHGLFASHPRNDKRLKTVINAAGQLDLDTYIEDPSRPGEFKQHINGLVWGQSIQGQRAETRFYHNKLDFTFETPPDWKVDTSSSSITATSAAGDARVALSLRKRDRSQSPRATLEGIARGTLDDGDGLELTELEGYSAVTEINGKKKRLAVIDFNNLSYLFEADADNFERDDEVLKQIIESFRAIFPSEKNVGDGNFVRYFQVPRGDSMESIAQDSPIDNAEGPLRLMNGFYPSGEPRIGDWIKIVE